MPNIIDYLKWRGDLNFEISSINEIDEIILSRVSYLPFQDIYLEQRENIKSIAKKMKIIPKGNFVWEKDKDLIEELAKSERYKNLILSDYSQKVDTNIQTQFGAITIWLPGGEKYISFEGTDMTMVGWKEDFNMSFMSNIPAQKEAVNYLEKMASKYTCNFRIGGHSKGGNLSVYAATFCQDEIKERIISILNADGPGFSKEIISSEKYQKIANKINTYIPQSSIVGRLLEHEEKYKIVESIEKGVMQHDVYSWQVERVELNKTSELTNESKMVNKMVKEWLNNTTIEQRKNFINAIYEILGTTEAKTIADFSADWFTNIKKIIETYKTMNDTEKKQMEEMIKLTLNSIKNCAKEEIFNKNKKK